MQRIPIYVYSWDTRTGKVHEYTGYYHYSQYHEALLVKRPNEHTTWFRKIPIKCGEIQNNTIWFTEPNLKQALIIFMKTEIDKLIELESSMQKTNRNIEYIAELINSQELHLL